MKWSYLAPLVLIAIILCGCVAPSPPPETTPPPVNVPPEGEGTPPPPPADTTPPETTIVSAPPETVTNGEVSFQWTGSDNVTPTAELVYSYMLEGYDSAYSAFTSATSKTYTDLPPGSYIFYVRAEDKAGNIDPTPAMASFSVATAGSGGLIILTGSEVNRIAVGADGESIYALDAVNSKLYKSIAGGHGWFDISAGVSGGATWNELALAPDTPDVVAVVTGARTEVSLSTNGGVSSFAMGLAANLAPGERVRCLALSPPYGESLREIAVGTSTGNGGGRVWVYVIPSAGWADASSGAPGWLPGAPPILGTDVFALEYSPAFAGDGVILAIVSSGPAPDTSDTYLYLGQRGAGGNTTWNGIPGYPVEICEAGGDTPGSPLTYADLTLPSDYDGSDLSWRHVYASWSDGPGGSPDDDVYRLDDAVCHRLYVGNIISTIAYYGASIGGKLLAGARMGAGGLNVPVYFTANPQSALPNWQPSLKPPTGPNDAQVAWSTDGKTAYCGTSGNQSAFSISTNNGLSWDQIGLIDG